MTAWIDGTDGRAMASDGTAFELGIRQRLDGIASALRRGGTIEGTTPLAGIAVTLDGGRTARTGTNGSYASRNVAPGEHVVSAELPLSRSAFFTTPSRVASGPGSRVDFGVVWTPARIIGRVANKAKSGVAGVVVTATSATGRAVVVPVAPAAISGIYLAPARAQGRTKP